MTILFDFLVAWIDLVDLCCGLIQRTLQIESYP